MCIFLLFFNATATTEIYTYLHTLSLHDALPILDQSRFYPFGDDGFLTIGEFQYDNSHIAHRGRRADPSHQALSQSLNRGGRSALPFFVATAVDAASRRAFHGFSGPVPSPWRQGRDVSGASALPWRSRGCPTDSAPSGLFRAG